MRRRGGPVSASSRRLPPLILLLLAAAAVALGPALGVGSSSPTTDVAGSAAFPAVHAAHGGIAGERRGTDRAPSRAGLGHVSAGPTAFERPTLDAVLPAVAGAGALLGLIVGYGGDEARRGPTLLAGSARSPPAFPA